MNFAQMDSRGGFIRPARAEPPDYKAPERAKDFRFEKIEASIEKKNSTYKMILEIADTPKKRARGLMARKFMPENTGMIFIKDYPQIISMWMKNTPLPLDMAFIDEEGRIFQIIRNAEPFSSRRLTSEKAAIAVIEIVSGSKAAQNLKIGDFVIAEPLRKTLETYKNLREISP